MSDPVEAWAVKGPEGLIARWSIRETELTCTVEFAGSAAEWKSYEDAGYRCVPVTITEREST